MQGRKEVQRVEGEQGEAAEEGGKRKGMIFLVLIMNDGVIIGDGILCQGEEAGWGRSDVRPFFLVVRT